MRLKEMRNARGLSQNELARQINMSLQGLQKLEYGKTGGIQFDVLNKLCTALNCLPGDLLVWTPEQE